MLSEHTFTKGASASLASRRAISVLPQPVGPIIRMFLGTTSSCTARQQLTFTQTLSTCRSRTP